ncbi:MAG: hypothetical protein HRT43_00395 [Campylobacteraceae bacterium]|nr:hypothetical protein [Campylobacteraceae bacterium]
MSKIVIIDYTQEALLDFIQLAYKEHFEIIKTTVKEEHDIVLVHIQTMENLPWEYEDLCGNQYINKSTFKKIFTFIKK